MKNVGTNIGRGKFVNGKERDEMFPMWLWLYKGENVVYLMFLALSYLRTALTWMSAALLLVTYLTRVRGVLCEERSNVGNSRWKNDEEVMSCKCLEQIDERILLNAQVGS